MSGKTEPTQAAIRKSPTADAVVAIAQGVINFMQLGYGVWITIYIILGILSVSLPGLAAMDVFESPKTNKILAGTGALVAAIVAFLKPHEYATGFDAACQLAWKTRNDFQLGAIDNVGVAKQLGRALDLTTFRYGVVDHLESNTETPKPEDAATPKPADAATPKPEDTATSKPEDAATKPEDAATPKQEDAATPKPDRGSG